MTYPDGSELPDLPEAGPAVLAAVKLQLGATSERDDALLETDIAAVNAMVRRLPCAVPVQEKDAWPADIVKGAVLMAARLFSRRNSPLGYADAGELGPIYVQRNDPDVAQLLSLGSYSYPMIG